MDHRSELRKAAVKAALKPVGRLRGRPVSELLARNGYKYRLRDGYVLPTRFVEPKSAWTYQILLTLYVDRISACVRYDERRRCLDVLPDADSRLALEERKLRAAAQNFLLVANALASADGDSLLAALLLWRIRPDLIDGERLNEDLMSQTVARGVGYAKAFTS